VTQHRDPDPPDPDPFDPGPRSIGADLDAGDLLATLAAPTDWSTLPAEDAPTAWAELRHWVHWLVARYSLDHHLVPPCWYLHPALVDLLTALRDHHRGSYSPLAMPNGPADWHATLNALEPRLREWVARTGCTRDQHRDDLPISWPEDTQRWQQHVAADQHARTNHDAPRPGR
jgi:hypothetical protein